MSRIPFIATLSGVLVLGSAAACSSAPSDSRGATSQSSAVSTPSAPGVTPAATATPVTSTTLACAALPSFNAALVAYPGADTDGPTPAAAQLSAWAKTASTPLAKLAAGVPSDVSSHISYLQTVVGQAGQGATLDADQAEPHVAAVDRWGHDSCNFQRLDVVNGGAALAGVPATLQSGPFSASFTNRLTGTKAGFVFLVARLKAGTHVTVDQVRTNAVDLTQVSDIIVAATPTAGGAAYANATLSPGHYIVASPLGSPPNFSGTLAAAFEVR